MSMRWLDGTRPDIGYEGMMPGRSDITDGESMAISQAGFRVGELREALESTVTEVQNQGAVLVDYGNALETKAEKWAVPTVAPLSQTINRHADPSFQLSDFMAPEATVTVRDDYEGGSSTRTATAVWSIPRAAGVKGRTYLTFITPAINRAYERLNFLVSSVTNPCQLDMAIMVVDPATRTITSELHLPNVTVSFGETVASVEFDPLIVTQGSYLMVAHLQHGAGNARTFFGLNDGDRPLSDLVFPRKISAVHTATGMTSIPTTIDGTTQVNFDYWFAPYMELSEKVAERPTLLHEPWPDVGTIGRPWVRMTSTNLYSGGGFVSASGFGYRAALYDTPMTSDAVRVTSSVYRTFDNNDRRSTLIVRSTKDMRSGVGVSVLNPERGGRYDIIAWTDADPGGSWSNRTVLASVNSKPVPGEAIEVDYVGGEVILRLNGQEVARADAPQYADARHRFVGVQTHRDGSVFVAYPSPWLGPWAARDLPQVDDGGGTGTEG